MRVEEVIVELKAHSEHRICGFIVSDSDFE